MFLERLQRNGPVIVNNLSREKGEIDFSDRLCSSRPAAGVNEDKPKQADAFITADRRITIAKPNAFK